MTDARVAADTHIHAHSFPPSLPVPQSFLFLKVSWTDLVSLGNLIVLGKVTYDTIPKHEIQTKFLELLFQPV